MMVWASNPVVRSEPNDERGCKPKPQKIPSPFRSLAQSLDGSDANERTQLRDGSAVQLRQAFRHRQALMDQDGVDALQIGKA